jgi:Tol biopolymer transport system component
MALAAVLVASVWLVACSSDSALPCDAGVRVVASRSSGPQEENRELVVTDPDGDPVRVISDDALNAEAPSFSPDGERIAYVASTGDYESAGPVDYTIWVVDVDGSNPARLTGPANWPRTAVGVHWNPDWSPNADEIVYENRNYEPDAGDDRRGLFVVTPAGESTRLTDPGAGAMDERPAWSPDGTQVAFVRREQLPFDPSGQYGLMVVDRDGANLRRVAAGAWEDVAWSPDGRSIYLAGERGHLDPERGSFRVVDVATGQVTVLGPAAGSLVWSPGGATLYVGSAELDHEAAGKAAGINIERPPAALAGMDLIACS